ncbi:MULTISPECIES: hypothetical protein [unclassified Bacillus (in: firmicutes)]|nr:MULTISPECIES: hypothetical protein [unclassified Bacillus (in: firmicutes)]MBT2638564.1 hypothetical protein [Bacillus sp. ISL-39]MBT2660569.1 hypothetical protein [Bacillus sp. ISL-45]
MLQRIYTFIKQWEPLPLLFLFFWIFFKEGLEKIHMRIGHETLLEAKYE